jgi:hypothetical protein
MLQCVNIYECAEREQLHEANGYRKVSMYEDSAPRGVTEQVDSQTKFSIN